MYPNTNLRVAMAKVRYKIRLFSHPQHQHLNWSAIIYRLLSKQFPTRPLRSRLCFIVWHGLRHFRQLKRLLKCMQNSYRHIVPQSPMFPELDSRI
jgi:hypothetical protein